MQEQKKPQIEKVNHISGFDYITCSVVSYYPENNELVQSNFINQGSARELTNSKFTVGMWRVKPTDK